MTASGQRAGLQDIWYLFKRNRRLFFWVVTVGMALAVTVVMSLEDQYSATAVVVLEPGSTTFETVSSRLRTVDPSVAQTEVEVLRSRQFAESIAERMALFDDPSFVPSLEEQEPLVDRATRWVLRGWRVVLDRTVGSDVTEAADETDTGEGAGAADTAGADAEALGLSKDLAGQSVDFLLREAVIDKLLGIYSIRYPGQGLAIWIETTYSDPAFAARVSNIVAQTYIEQTLKRQRSGINNAIEFLQKRADSAIFDLTVRQSELAALIRSNSLDDSGQTEAMLAELARLRAIADLEEPGEDSDIRQQIEQRTQALWQRTQSELDRAQLELALQIERQHYLSIAERLSEYEAQRDSLTPTARQITAAQPPKEPSEPRRSLALAVAFAALCSFAFVFVLFREGLDTRIWTAARAEEASGLASLGHIPYLPTGIFQTRARIRKHLRRTPHAPFAEAVRSLVIAASAQVETEGCFALMVTSGLPNEGKSTISFALSTLAALDGLRVLLIDLDVRNPEATRMLNQGENRAFKAKHSQKTVQAALDDLEVFQACVRPSQQFKGLDVVNFDPQSHFGLKLGADRTAEAQIEEFLRETYDLVVIDTPSYFVADDANRFAAFADAAVLLARSGHTKEEELRDSADLMWSNRIPLAGVAVNAVVSKRPKRFGHQVRSVLSGSGAGA